MMWRGAGGGDPGVMRAGSLREVEGQREGDGIPMGVGVVRNGKQIL